MANVSLQNLSKRFGDVVAVDNISLDIRDKELMVLVGPSGCGKTTTLRLIAGLEKATSGNIIIGNKLMNFIPPYKRNIAMVFQNFALYPHMTTYGNIAFSLEVEKLPRNEVRKRVYDVAKMLEIDMLLDRRPAELSGGQKQRVALGRAVVRNPIVLLMDEPLSNLDAQLRVLMRSELKKLTREIETTTIYVTHDQVEAMTMGNRIVVMNEGQIQQVDTPDNVYNWPINIFVAKLIGSPPMNIFEAEVHYAANRAFLETESIKIELNNYQIKLLETSSYSGGKLLAGIRPECIRLESSEKISDNEGWAKVEVETIEPQGSDTILNLSWGQGRLVVRVDPETSYSEGDKLAVTFQSQMLRLFDPDTNRLLYKMD
jgi:multiple sugar transport system ATP-binding protein